MNLGLPSSSDIIDAPIEYRFLSEKHQFDSATVAYYQTDLGIPVWEAGVAIQMKLGPFHILSAQSTRHADLKVEAPSRSKAKKAKSLTEAELALAATAKPGSEDRGPQPLHLSLPKRESHSVCASPSGRPRTNGRPRDWRGRP